MRLLLAAVFTAAAGAAAAHDTWLLADRYQAAPASRITLDLTSGQSFPRLEHAIKLPRIARAGLRLAGKSAALKGFKPSARSLRTQVRLPAAGVATLWVELKPHPITLNAKQVAEYLREINLPQSVGAAWIEALSPPPWREVYTKSAKTFVRVGGKSDRSWAEPVGLGLEIVPEKDPTALRAGDEFEVRVLMNGNPLPGFSIGIVGKGGADVEFRRTDSTGRAVFRLRRAGAWLLRGTDLRRVAAADRDWDSAFTTLSVEVR